MLPGPDDVLECPACHTPTTSPTILSGNTFGARFYTDGYVDAPMLPARPALVRCPACAAPFVRREARVLGALDLFDISDEPAAVDPAWRKARRVAPAEPDDYVRVLDTACFDRETELVLLVELWHLGNHARRELPDGEPGVPLSPQEIGTLHRLAAVLDPADPRARLLLAEVRRALGQFDEALALLASPFPERWAATAARIRALAQGRDSRVARLS